MTKQEILDYFKDINFMYNNSSMFDTLKGMLDELTEPCEDAVSRAFLLNHRTHIIAEGLIYPVVEIKTIMDAPSVQPIPVMYYPQVPGVTPCVVPDYKDGWRLQE